MRRSPSRDHGSGIGQIHRKRHARRPDQCPAHRHEKAAHKNERQAVGDHDEQKTGGLRSEAEPIAGPRPWRPIFG